MNFYFGMIMIDMEYAGINTTKQDLINKFYRDHVVKYGKNFSFSILFLLQPEGGNGLGKYSLEQIKQNNFILTSDEKEKGIALFISICTYLYPHLSLLLRRNFIQMIGKLPQEHVLKGQEGIETLKDKLLTSMRTEYQEKNKIHALSFFYEDFPEYRDSSSEKRVHLVVTPQKKTLFETLSAFLEGQGERDQIEISSKELVSILVTESSSRNIKDFKQEFLLLEELKKLDGTSSTLKNISLLLLVRYYYATNFSVGSTDPTWDHIITTYQISLDELLIILDKKKRSNQSLTKDGNIIDENTYEPTFANIKRLIETYSSEQWQNNTIASGWIKNLFMHAYTTGIYSICYYLQKTLPFLGNDDQIKLCLPYISAGEHSSEPLTTKIDVTIKNLNNLRVMKAFVDAQTTEGLQNAEGFINSLSGDQKLVTYLRQNFGNIITALSVTCSPDFLREAISFMKEKGLPISEKIYTNFMKLLLIHGKSNTALLGEIKQLSEDFPKIKKDGIAYIDELFIDELMKHQLQYGVYLFYPKDTFDYIASTHLLTKDELFSRVAQVLINLHSHTLTIKNYYNETCRSFFTEFKASLCERCKDNSDELIHDLIEKNCGSSFEYKFILSDLFNDFFTEQEVKTNFQAYLNFLIGLFDYQKVIQLFTAVGNRYTDSIKLILQNFVSRLYDKNKHDEADEIITKAQLILPETVMNSMKEKKITYLLDQGKLTDYIADSDIHERFDNSEIIKKHIVQQLSLIDFKSRKKGEVQLSDFQYKMCSIFLDEDFVGNEELKILLAQKSLIGFNSRSSIPTDLLDLYQYLQLHYGENVDQVHKVALKQFRKLNSTIGADIGSGINNYAKLLLYTKQTAEHFEKKIISLKDDQRIKGHEICDEWKNLIAEVPVYEYNRLLSHIKTSLWKVENNEKLREPRDYKQRNDPRSSRTHKEDDLIYFSKQQLPEQFKQLIDIKLPLVPEKEQRKLRRETMESWFSFYEFYKDYEGIAMLETVYGYTFDRTEKQRKMLRDFLQFGDKEKIAQLTELIALFGMSNAADILFQLYPDYKGLPPDEIQSILSHYLGDLLLNHKGIGLHRIPEFLDISGLGLLDSLFTVIERDFVRIFTETKKHNPNQTNKSICEGYIADLGTKFAGIKGNHPKLADVYTHFKTFIASILAVNKPEKFIDYLVAGREFPDFLQKLNAALVADKKRFLIADGMGLGKSLSAILAKEHCGAKSCLVVVPSLVTGTRQGYLSDVDDPTTKKRGYYKPGLAPRVFTIDTPADVGLLKQGPYDYVLISQEKLQGDEYVDAIIAQGFDFMIVDEIHKLKNISEGKRAGGLLRITEHIETHGGSLCLLSGTPLPNKIADIAILLKLLYPEKYASVDNADLVNSIIKGGDMLNLRSLLLPMMQMKKLTDHVDMPELKQSIKQVTLSAEEQLYYDAFVEDNTMSGSEKVMFLRKFLLNPQLVGVHTSIQSSKAKVIGEDANTLFKTKDKIVFFANGFRSGILREKEGVEKTFIEQMHLDSDIEIRIIDGTNTSERQKIQDEFNSSEKKIALFISGSTADVGIDLTAGEHIIHINEPRTQADTDQQEARVYRYGQLKDIETTTYITSGSLEQGIHDYITMKHQIILKLYYGLKLSDLERKVIIEAESEIKKGSSAVNTTLTKYIRTAKEKLNNMFGYLREGGLERIESLVETRGKELAEYYALLGPRSYQANVNRMHGTLLDIILKKENTINQKIVDLGCGPKMLEQHADDSFLGKIINVDINPNHFTPEDIASGRSVVSNFGELPFEDNEIDVCCSSLSFNETAWSRSQKEYERLNVLLELHRILKPGGVAIISMIYSLQYKYPQELKTLLTEIGFEIVPEYSGTITGGKKSSFETKTLVLRKTTISKRHFYYGRDMNYLKEKLIKREDIKGLDMIKDNVSLSEQEYVLDEITIIPDSALHQPYTTDIKLNKSGKSIKETEKNYKNLVDEMKLADGVTHIENIKETTLRKRGFGRYMNAASCVLMARLPNNAGLFRYSSALKKG